MKAQVARPGLQHADEADLPAEEAWIAGQLLHRRRRGTKQQGIELALLAAGKLAQRGRQGEGEKEVWHRQQQVLLARQPGLSRGLLTGRTVTILARVVAVTCRGTSRTGVDLPAECLGATSFNCSQRCAMTREHALAVACPIGRSIPAEDLTERAPDRPAVNCSSASVACTSALRVR